MTRAELEYAARVMAYRLRRVVRHVAIGRVCYRYPWCCVMQFAWDGLIGVKSGLVRGIGFERASAGERWVPCGWRHKTDPIETARRQGRLGIA